MNSTRHGFRFVGLCIAAGCLVACQMDGDTNVGDGQFSSTYDDGENECSDGVTCYSTSFALDENEFDVIEVEFSYGVKDEDGDGISSTDDLSYLTVRYYHQFGSLLFTDRVVDDCDVQPIITSTGESVERDSIFFVASVEEGLEQISTGNAATSEFGGCRFKIEDNGNFQLDPQEAHISQECGGESELQTPDITSSAVGPDETCDGAIEECDDDKALVCHIPPGNPDNHHEICISSNAVDAHIRNHGDHVIEAEICDDGIDNDCDGGTDEDDSDCEDEQPH